MIAEMWVGTDGRPSDIKKHKVEIEPLVNEEKQDAFIKAALETARGYRFKPALEAGQPVRKRIRISIVFTVATRAAPHKEKGKVESKKRTKQGRCRIHAHRGSVNKGSQPNNGSPPDRGEETAGFVEKFSHSSGVTQNVSVEGVETLRRFGGRFQAKSLFVSRSSPYYRGALQPSQG